MKHPEGIDEERRAHRAKVEAEILEDLAAILSGEPEEDQAVLDALKAGKIRHVTVNY